MSDQTDSSKVSEDANASQAAISQEQTGETQSGNSLAGEALVQAVLNDQTAREALRRQFQSDKDKGVEEIRKQLKDLEGRLNNSQETSGGEKPVEAQIQASETVNITAIKQAFPDIKLDDPDVLPRIANKMNDEAGLLVELGRIRLQRLNKPAPTTASVTPPTGVTKTASSAEDVQSQIEGLLGNREKMLSFAGRKELKELRAKLQEIEQG